MEITWPLQSLLLWALFASDCQLWPRSCSLISSGWYPLRCNLTAKFLSSSSLFPCTRLLPVRSKSLPSSLGVDVTDVGSIPWTRYFQIRFHSLIDAGHVRWSFRGQHPVKSLQVCTGSVELWQSWIDLGRTAYDPRTRDGRPVRVPKQCLSTNHHHRKSEVSVQLE